MLKLWRNMSVSKKIFVGTLTAMLALSVIFFLGQLFFFHKYYTYLITQRLTNSVRDFSKEYITLNSDEEINNGIIEYSNNGDFYIMVMGENGDLLHMVTYEMSILTEDGQERRVTLDNAIRSKQFQSFSLKKGDYVTVECRAPRNSDVTRIYVPDSIYADGRKWITQHSPFDENDKIRNEFKNEIFSGEILSITLPSQQNAGTAIQRREAFAAAMDWRFRTHLTEKQEEEYHYFYSDAESENEYIVAVKNIEKAGRGEVVLAITPMQTVDEAVAVAKRLCRTLIPIELFVAGLAAFIFSGMVSKPILNMSAVTKKMRNLDFSEKCVVKGNDEIGILAQNINDMSERLDTAIDELKRANEKLVEDIEHERMLENQRKEFVAAVSHELKTPLAVIQAYAEGIMDGISGENKDKYLQVILDETKRMDCLVLEMLENSRLEARVEELDIQEHDLADMAKEIWRRFEKTVSDGGIEFVLEVPNEPVIRKFDLRMIERVTENFITNAIFHTQKGGRIVLCVSGDRLSVENSGKHIKDSDIERIWDKFYKVDKSRTRSGSGTGLGLSIAKNILELHFAEYGVENTADGVRFWFEIK